MYYVEYKIVNPYEDIVNNIKVPLSLAWEGLELSKLLCKDLNIRYEIHLTIINSCDYDIKQCYPIFPRKEIRDYMKIYCKEEFENIDKLNDELYKTRKDIKDIISLNRVKIERDMSVGTKIIYDLDLREAE